MINSSKQVKLLIAAIAMICCSAALSAPGPRSGVINFVGEFVESCQKKKANGECGDIRHANKRLERVNKKGKSGEVKQDQRINVDNHYLYIDGYVFHIK